MDGVDNVTDKTFQVYLENTQLMENYPGVQAFAFVKKLSAENLNSHINKRKKEFPKYKIWPPSDDVDITSITYIAPMNSRNSRAVGYNMMTEPIRRSAMEKARDTGRPALSKMLVLIQEDGIDPQPGFILYAPIYGNELPSTVSDRRNQLVGYVSSPFRIRDFISAVVRQSQTGRVDFKIYSSEKVNEENLLYHHDWHAHRKKKEMGPPDLIKSLSIGENAFKVHFYADPEWRSYRTYYFPLIIAFLGLLLTILIMRIFFITKNQIDVKQSALNARDEFLSIASHELKTPITSLQLQLQMTKRKIEADTSFCEAQEKIVRSMDNSIYQVSRVTRLIDDLLEISRIENGKQTYYFENTDISILISQICESHSDQIAVAGIQLRVNLVDSLVIECDSFKIEQVFSNLLNNSIKYGAGSPIHVALTEEEGYARISVKDAGPGIPEELQTKIFERFERVTPHKTVSGLGLGLYISKQIVVAHRGAIHVKSKEGVGSEFIVLIPKTQA